MKGYADFKHSAEGRLKDMKANVVTAHGEMVGACSTSSDPKVTAAHARWKAYQEFVAYLEAPKKESDQ